MEQTGLLAFNETLAKLSQIPIAESEVSRSETNLSSAVFDDKTVTSSDALTAGVTSDSGLTDSANLLTLAALQQRLLTPESSSMAAGGEAGTGTGPQRVAGAPIVAGLSAAKYNKVSNRRSEEQIQGVLNRHKHTIYKLYNRELIAAPGLQGKVVVSVTITPSGRVSRSLIIDSELASSSLESGLLRLIAAIDFGAIAKSPTVTTRVPIDFFPQ
ncbi:MAG: AgmX/PglI C-terminal domain-containing protein [Motiliproteus sp.]